MIKEINLKDIATFSNTGVLLTNLNKVNIIYGTNGTGKTTISEYLHNHNKEKEEYLNCKLEWNETSENPEMLVYNRNFVKRSLAETDAIKGIFTIGEEAEEKEQLIKRKRKDNDDIDVKQYRNEEKLSSKIEVINNEFDHFTKLSWEKFNDYKESLGSSFHPYRAKKIDFVYKLIQVYESNEEFENQNYGKLIERYKTIYIEDEKTYSEISLLPIKEYILKSSIFRKKIIGAKDVEIAEMIDSMGISDWVRKGHDHFRKSSPHCPFCQQETDKDFVEQLNNYFDKTYDNNLNELRNNSNEYERYLNEVYEYLNIISDDYIDMLDEYSFKNEIFKLEKVDTQNKKLLSDKANEPSIVLELNDITNNLIRLNELIKNANVKIQEINRVQENISEEKEKLKKDVWKFIAIELNAEFDYCKTRTDNMYKAADGILRSIEKNKVKIQNNKDEIKIVETEITSTAPSKDKINDLLKKFGFTGFELKDSPKIGYYQLVRGDGSIVRESLSEGEKTFITFLYFYESVLGQDQEEYRKRIIVIDDPISSLDSDVMFVVSQLIKDLKHKVEDSQFTRYLQMFILTHNIYFHKEITYKPVGDNSDNQHYWIMRKDNNISSIQAFKNRNPIKNSYALLWEEMSINKNSSLLPNILRRILEVYFRHFGGLNIDQEITKFDGNDKLICASLVKWAHDGSHHYQDDLYMQHRSSDNLKFLSVFKEIFNNSGHSNHFNMMTRESENESE